MITARPAPKPAGSGSLGKSGTSEIEKSGTDHD